MKGKGEQEIRKRVIELLECYYEEGLDEHGGRELNALLRESQAACDAYLSFTYLHGALAWRMGNGTENREDQAEENAGPVHLRQKLRRYLRRPEALSLAVATGVMGLIIAVTAYIAAPVFRSASPADDPAQPTVASVTGDHAAVWTSSGAAKERGSPLQVGQRIQLDSGLVEITYFNGAQVLVEGPADFVVAGSGSGGLDAGKVTAYVPPEAIGFSIGTPVGTAKDLGTEFGVHVRDKDSATFAVFSGKIEVQTNSRVGSELRSRVLLAGESLQVTAEGARFESQSDMRDKFVLNLPGASGEFDVDPQYVDAVKALDPIAYWRFEDFEGNRVLSEGSPTFELERVGRVLPFGEEGSNRVAAFRPRGVKSCLVGDAALTARLNELKNEITVIAWIKTSSREHQAIVHQWGGGEALSLEIREEQSGFVLNFENHIPVHLFSGRPMPVGRWVMLAGVYDGREMRMFEDGEFLSRQVIPEDAGLINNDTHNLHLGHRSELPEGQFAGGMDEVAIFDRALSASEIERAYIDY